MFGHPGKKLLFMGGELGQWREWNHDTSLDWHLLAYDFHRGLQRWVRDLNTFYRGEPALYEMDSEPAGFERLDCNEKQRSIVSFLRRGQDATRAVVVVCNFTPVPRHNYRIGVPFSGFWHEALNSDAPLYGGSGQGNIGGVEASPVPMHGRPYSLNMTVPPLGVVLFRPMPGGGAQWKSGGARRARFGTRTRRSTSFTFAPSMTATTTASAIFRGCSRTSTPSSLWLSPVF